MHKGTCLSVHDPHIAAGDLQQTVIHCVGAAQRLQRYTQPFSKAVTILTSYSNVNPLSAGRLSFALTGALCVS